MLNTKRLTLKLQTQKEAIKGSQYLAISPIAGVIFFRNNLQPSPPDIAETHRGNRRTPEAAMVLQPERSRFAPNPELLTGVDRNFVLHQDAVENDGDRRLLGDPPIGRVALRGLENDIEGLPLARLASGIDERRGLVIETAERTVAIGRIFVGIENLNLVFSMEEYPAIPA